MDEFAHAQFCLSAEHEHDAPARVVSETLEEAGWGHSQDLAHMKIRIYENTYVSAGGLA
jgi:hypothetical protein